jgi:hypothetical protein
MMAVFSEFIEEIVEVFMDDFSVSGKMFMDCLANLDKVLTRCAEVDLVLNWEKCHFMVKKGIVLTPKNGTGKGLTCAPSLVTKYHSARKDLLRGFVKDCLRSVMRHHSAKGLFAHLKGSFRECMVTWPDVRKE